MSVLSGKTALVTGASSGLGADFARLLAARGCHLICVARRTDRLQRLREEIVAQHPSTVEIIAMDLSAPEAAQQLHDRVGALGRTVDVLINNAGFGVYGDFLDIPWPRERDMLALDILTLTHLTKLFAKDMVARRFGYVLLVASITAYQPTPTYATYGAAKSFVVNFGEALSYELRGTGVRVCIVSPGITATEFLAVTGQKATLYERLMMMDSPTVARYGLDAMLRGQTSVVPGWRNAVPAFLLRFVPRRVAAALADAFMRYGS